MAPHPSAVRTGSAANHDVATDLAVAPHLLAVPVDLDGGLGVPGAPAGLVLVPVLGRTRAPADAKWYRTPILCPFPEGYPMMKSLGYCSMFKYRKPHEKNQSIFNIDYIFWGVKIPSK